MGSISHFQGSLPYGARLVQASTKPSFAPRLLLLLYSPSSLDLFGARTRRLFLPPPPAPRIQRRRHRRLRESRFYDSISDAVPRRSVRRHPVAAGVESRGRGAARRGTETDRVVRAETLGPSYPAGRCRSPSSPGSAVLAPESFLRVRPPSRSCRGGEDLASTDNRETSDPRNGPMFCHGFNRKSLLVNH